MIHYDSHQRRILLLLRWKGSVIPRTFKWSIPSGVAAAVLHIHTHGDFNVEGMLSMWSSFTFVLGFCVVFHNNQAYYRFQEGTTLINQVRGEWYNAISTIVAMTTSEDEIRPKVDEFNHLLVRLMSMLYCAALQQVAQLEDDNFDIIDNSGLNPESLRWLSQNVGRCEIILQWIQRLVYEAHGSGIISAAPPLLSRAFQELSRGVVNLNNVKKIKEIPFPFPYVQVSVLMLMLHWIFMPIMASQTCDTWYTAFTICFIVQTCFWSLHHIAQEIEQPFGEDENDLPLAEMQMDMNRGLCVLLDTRTQVVPEYRFNRRRDDKMLTRASDLDMLYDVVAGQGWSKDMDKSKSDLSSQGGSLHSVLSPGFESEDEEDSIESDIVPPRGKLLSAAGTIGKKASIRKYSDRVVSFLSAFAARQSAMSQTASAGMSESPSMTSQPSAKSWGPQHSAIGWSPKNLSQSTQSSKPSRLSFQQRVEAINQSYREYYSKERLRAMVHLANRQASIKMEAGISMSSNATGKSLNMEGGASVKSRENKSNKSTHSTRTNDYALHDTVDEDINDNGFTMLAEAASGVPEEMGISRGHRICQQFGYDAIIRASEKPPAGGLSPRHTSQLCQSGARREVSDKSQDPRHSPKQTLQG